MVWLAGFFKASSTQVLAAAAVAASAINIGGGFTITQRMLDMFKRPGDPEEHNYLYAIPGGALMAGAAVGHFAGGAACCGHAHSQQLPYCREESIIHTSVRRIGVMLLVSMSTPDPTMPMKVSDCNRHTSVSVMPWSDCSTSRPIFCQLIPFDLNLIKGHFEPCSLCAAAGT